MSKIPINKHLHLSIHIIITDDAKNNSVPLTKRLDNEPLQPKTIEKGEKTKTYFTRRENLQGKSSVPSVPSIPSVPSVTSLPLTPTAPSVTSLPLTPSKSVEIGVIDITAPLAPVKWKAKLFDTDSKLVGGVDDSGIFFEVENEENVEEDKSE